MSQYPPPPPGQQPPYPQQPGMPPPGAGMPPGGYTMAPQPKRSNVPAIMSLILGILGCIPFITGLFAVILGIVGIRKTKDPQVGGKGLAIVGIVLGLISLACWGLFGGGIYAAWAYGKPAREAASQFAKDLSAGNIQAAQARTTKNISPMALQDAADKLKAMGTVQDTTLPITSFNSVNGVTTCEVGGVASFPNNKTVPYFAHLVKEGDSLKIDGFVFQDHVVVGTTPKIAGGKHNND